MGGRTHRLPGLRTGHLSPNPVRPHRRVIWDSRAHTQPFIYRNAGLYPWCYRTLRYHPASRAKTTTLLR